MKSKLAIVMLLAVIFILGFLKARAEIIGGLDKDTVNIKLYGHPINWGSALNIKLSVSNPNVANLSLESPTFNAQSANALLTSSDPSSGTVTVLWDGYIPNNEADIEVKLAPGTTKGLTNISVDKVELAGGFDITDKIVVRLDNSTVVNTAGKQVTPLGDFELIDPGTLVSPGRATISFDAQGIPANLVAKLNGEEVSFLDMTGLAQVTLPHSGDELKLTLDVTSGNQNKLVNLGKVRIIENNGPKFPARISRVVAYNDTQGPKLRIRGRRFGVRMFGKENTIVKVVPQDVKMSSNKLKRFRGRGKITKANCVQKGSYVNVVHSAGTATKKIHVKGECNS